SCGCPVSPHAIVSTIGRERHSVRPTVKGCRESTGHLVTCRADPPALPSFPTRRSSDLERILDLLVHSHEGRRIFLLLFDRRTVRSEEHTSELQSRENLVCRLLLEKKKAFGSLTFLTL